MATRNTLDWRYYHQDENEQNDLARFLRGAGLVLAATVAGVVLYRSGILKPAIQKALTLSGDVGVVDDYMKGLREWSQQEDNFIKLLGRTRELPQYLTSRREVKYELSETLISAFKEFDKIRTTLIAEAGQKQISNATLQSLLDELQDEMRKSLIARFGVTPESQSTMLKAAGVRYATVGDLADLISQGKIKDQRLRMMNLALSSLGLERSSLRIDPGLLINDAGEIVDRAKLSSAVRNVLTSLENDFAIPFAGFNPLRLFRMSNILGLRKSPLVYLMDDEIHPMLTGKLDPIRRAAFVGGKVFDLDKSLSTGRLERINANIGYLLPMSDPVAREHFRAMAGIPSRVYKAPEKGIRGAYAKILRAGGFGFQDAIRWGDPDFKLGRVSGSFVDINDLFADISWKVINKLRPWTDSEIPHLTQKFMSQRWMYVNQAHYNDFYSFIGQIFAGRKNLTDVTTLTLIPYTGFSRMNTMMANFGLALPIEHMGSTVSVFSNMFLRRAAFIGLGMFAWHYFNYEMENLFGFRPEVAAMEVWADTTVALSAAGERVGLPDRIRRMRQLMPGVDHVEELPGIKQLIFWTGMTPEEVREYWESGEDPIRKGRFWPMGGTPFTGERIQYYRPNRLRLLKSKWQYTDTLYGSEEEYFAHAPIPTPRYPLAPIRRYVTDKYWQERTTYYERPYPVTGGYPELEGVPLIGPLLGYISDIIKPRLRMHTEHIEGTPKDVQDALSYPRGILKPPESGVPIIYRKKTSSDRVSESIRENMGLPFNLIKDAPQIEIEYPVVDPRSPKRTLEQLWSNMAEMMGFYGFAAETLRAEERTKWYERDLATASTMTSWNRLFWDKDLGGLGGDVNEILRRALVRRHKVERDFNPIPNRMPSWIPEDSLYDFHHGDPYSKVRFGEVRLPGAAYESIYFVPAAEYIKAHPVLSELDKQGIINRYEFYDPINRLRILANIAPWSEEFRETSKQLSSMKLTKEQTNEVRKIREQARRIREPMRLYPYRFRYKDLKTERVTVKEILNRNTILTEEYPYHPIRLAGIKAGKTSAEKTEEWLRERLPPGTKITIGYDADSKIAQDTYRTIRAVVYEGKENINRALIEQELAEEKEDDYSAPALHVRFSRAELVFGNIWERFAHLDTPVHTKMLRVRSAYEEWLRADVYGKRVALWQRPISDFVVPTYQSFISRSPLLAIASGVILGSLFGRNNYGRMVGAALGGSLVGAGVLYRKLYEIIEGKRWVPARRRKEWEMEEYIDILKYIKFRRLFEAAAKRAQEQEDFDVIEYIEAERKFKSEKKERLEELNWFKRRLYTGKVKNIKKELRALGLEPAEDIEELDKAAMRAVNQEIRAVQQSKYETEELPPISAAALEYYRQMRATMYAYEPGEPLSDFISALPKKERRYFRYFLQMPEEEYEKLKDVAPDWLFYGLAPARGDAPPPKPSLEEYFQNRFLPDENWQGWLPDVSLDDVRIKLAKHMVPDVRDVDIWPDDEARAMLSPAPAPQMYRARERGHVLREKLESLLSASGIEDIETYLDPYDDGLVIDVDLDWDVRSELIDLINNDPTILLT